MRLSLFGDRPAKKPDETVTEFLRHVKILHELTQEQIAVVCGLAKSVQFRRGTPIITEGEAGDSMHLLTEGTVDISISLTLETSRGEVGTKDKHLIRLRAEDHPIFGEMALLGTDVRSATVTAASDCTTLVLTKDDLQTLEREHPEIAYLIVRHIAEELCERVKGLNRQQLKLTTALSIALSRR